jgi:RNA polymerase sigma-70 factor (ECF subfamily)
VQRVRAALDELPEPTRTAFVLFRYEGLSCAEVAETQGVPQKTVETRIARAAELLADKLRPYRHHAANL